jgi:hypothetical protein
LLAGKLVPVVVIHAVIGITRLTRNQVPHNQHKMRITSHDQSTRLPFGFSPGKVKNPSQSPRSEPKIITFLRSTILAAPSRLGGGNHQENTSESHSETQSPSASRRNHSSNALRFTLNLTKMMNL